MCGICGKFCFDGEVVDRDLVAKMCDTIIHRGPDDEGIYTAPYVGLGQRRLSVIDLRRDACPPLSNEDQTIWLTYNGEIYNFQELREELLTLGHRFQTNADTEVIIHLYEEEGLDCLNRLEGMFAFALWDANKKRIFAARDRLGKKPFCYAKRPGSFVFGSEIKAITVDPEIASAPDRSAIDLYMTYAYVPAPYTAFEGIRKLPPGHFLTCDTSGHLEVEQYWNAPTVEPTTAKPEEIQEEIVRLFREAVRARLISDVPLGAFLSGGIDSATVVALMAEESSKPVKTFSIGFEEDEFSELPYARMVADRYQTDHHELVVQPASSEILPLLVKHYNEPFADPSALPTYYVSKLARENVTVALSGDGGDESFSGYDHYSTMLNWGKLDGIPAGIRHAISSGGELALKPFPNHNFLARVLRGFWMLDADLRGRYLLSISQLKPNEKSLLYTDQFKSYLQAHGDQADPLREYPYDASMDAINWLARHDQNFYLPSCLMVKSDIASMANSLELRCPLLDHKIVEFAASIPSKLKRDAGVGKRIMRDAVKSLLPEKLINKPKMGFCIPLEKWLRTDLSDMLKDALLDGRLEQRGLFEAAHLERMVQEHINGTRVWSNRLWGLLMLELWFREFVD